MKNSIKRLAAAAAAMLMVTGTSAYIPYKGSIGTLSSITASAASDKWKLDLGGNAQNGFTGVSANDKYNKNKGYGFSGNDVKNVGAAGKNELSDAVQFTGKTTLNVDVPNGVYKIKVTLGNTSRTSVFIENMLQIVNMTGNNAVHELLVPITDGQVNIRAGAGKSGTTFSISAIEINKYSDSTTLPPTIWLCGDSTVCNYYPLNSSKQAGWGQMLGNYVDKGWNIRNMAASGEYAKGFINNGNFAPIEKYGKKGDVFIISIGINDGKYYKGDEYKKYVGDMTKRAKAKGMDVILVKQQGRKGDSSKKPLLKSRYFSNELDQIAKEQNCQVVDLFNLFQDYCVSIGSAKADAMYIDNVHPNREGASRLAELFAKQLKQKPGASAPVVTEAPQTQPVQTQPPQTQPPQTQPPQTQPQPVQTQAPQTQPQPSAPNASLWGDVNGNGKVELGDAILIMQSLSNPSKYIISDQGRVNADVSESGNGITNADALSIQKYCLGLISFLPESVSSNPQQQPVQTQPAQQQPVQTQPAQQQPVQQPALENMYFASDMKITNGAPEDTNKGFKGKSYVNLDNNTNSSIEWTVNVPQAGNYLCTFNIANGSADNRKMKIEVNNGKDYWIQDFLTTGDWTKWEERGLVLPLKQGTNSIKMTSATAQGGPNLDYMTTEFTDEPIAQIYETPTTPVVDNPNKNAARTIYIAGDSTVQTYNKSYAPQQGWGAHLGDNLSDKVTVSNQAIAGRSSKSFYDNGRLDTILKTIKKGDYLLVQFGINDAASNKAERYAPTSGKVPGSKGSFEDYMAKYIEGAQKKGATPILVTTVIGLKAYDKGSKTFKGSYTNYCNAMKQLAKYYNIPVIDLNTLMVQHYNSIGYDAAYKYHMCSTGGTDMTHFTETGAKAVAKLVADELKKQGLV